MALALSRRGLGLIVVSAMIVASPKARGQVVADEYQIKAAFLPNFAKFVYWPSASLGPAGAPLVIGIVGDDPFGVALKEAVNGQSVDGHSLEVRHLQWKDSFDGCDILFIASSEVNHVSEILASVAGQAVLTVADFDSFARRGGMIELKTIGHRVRFDINTVAASAAGLRISSKLLSLAARVYASAEVRP
jgi:YfiR/HmsC-like